MEHLTDALQTFLRHGGQASFVVGIDLQNTTREGLKALLDLEDHGQSETFVFHNEGGGIFHPKLYLFRNEEEARLVVGSNNLTESGLYVNVEAGLQVDTGIDAELVGQTLDALSSWKDTSTNLAARLDRSFLARLFAEGYVQNEATAQQWTRPARRSASGQTAQPLFGTRRFAAPAPRPRANKPSQTVAQSGAVASVGTVLLMRLRKAHAKDRRTQTQIPFRVMDTFFKGAGAVRSAHSGEEHGIIEASARGGLNTIKLEIPEMREFSQPMARFERTPDGILYETYDLSSPQGSQIMARLEEGRRSKLTQMTISDADRATWWRFI